MPHDRLASILAEQISELEVKGIRKGSERVICGVLPAENGRGPRFLIEGHGDKPFLRMNANSYLGLSFHAEVISAEEEGVRRSGTGPGAVRFISGTWGPHAALEDRLAAFHGREAAILFSSAYAAVMGLLPPLITTQTAVISDELNHNCIINAIRLATPGAKFIYRHLCLNELESCLQAASRTCKRAIVVTDGVFSMRGDHAPIHEIVTMAKKYDSRFEQNVLVVVDDSHGVGVLGATGRGAEEHTGSAPADLLVATLGKAFGVNGGYAVSSQIIINYLRETSPFYIYSNPIAPGEAAAANEAINIVDSSQGSALLKQLRSLTKKFREGLQELGCETVLGVHPITPWLVRDTPKTKKIVAELFDRGILVTGLNYPVVPEGEDKIRFQLSADHTLGDIDEVLEAIHASIVRY